MTRDTQGVFELVIKQYERTPLSKIIRKHGIAGIHPAAELLPMMTDEEFQAMCIDVARKGFVRPVLIDHDKMLIDGRNRLQVGWALELDPSIEEVNLEDVFGYVLSENIARRQLTFGQRTMVAEKLAKLPHGVRSDRDPNSDLYTYEEVATMLATRPQAIAQARIIRVWAKEEAKEVEAGDMALDKAFRLANARKKEAEAKEKPEKSKKSSLITLSGVIDKKLVGVEYPQPKGKHTFNQTNDAVDWASWTWNPVTGCLHGCKYCYAREMAYRESYAASYPIQFAPLFHHERLDDPINTEPGNERVQDGRVFVCSMADLFGEWVPQDWIDAVFDATLKAPEWEYLFLTKFPQRYRRINLPPKAWFGASVDIQKRVRVTEKAMPGLDVAVRWISVEPMLEPIAFNDLSWCDLVVIGAQSETMQPDGPVPAFAPKLEWVIDLIAQARNFDVPVYLKPNLLGDLTGSKPGMQLPQEQPRRRKK